MKVESQMPPFLSQMKTSSRLQLGKWTLKLLSWGKQWVLTPLCKNDKFGSKIKQLTFFFFFFCIHMYKIWLKLCGWCMKGCNEGERQFKCSPEIHTWHISKTFKDVSRRRLGVLEASVLSDNRLIKWYNYMKLDNL